MDGKRDFDKEAPTWDEKPQRVQLAGDITKAIREEVALTRAMDALDFGCGTGLVTLALQPFVGSMTGIDSSQGMLDVLQGKVKTLGLNNVRTSRLNVEKGDVPEGRYDLIVSSMTLHHIEKTEPLIKAFAQVLNHGGYLCIADLDSDGGRFHADNTGVFHYGFDRAKLVEVFTGGGLIEARSRTATQTVRPVSAGGTESFTIFLISGYKKP
jgi:ubiquinone/menaquinone biosynthesis C-methylase UbiE